MNVQPRRIRPSWPTALVTLSLLAALAGCGDGSADAPPPGPGASGGSGSAPASKPPANGPSGTLKLTGFYTYDGPFTGMFVCHYDKDGYFALEGQEPYLIDIVVHEMREGTFVVHEQDPATGFSKVDPGQPKIDVRRLDKVDDPDEDVLMRQAGGTITFADGGDTGTLSVDYVNDFGRDHEKTHVELRWTGCVRA